jgi:hypothetical protein
MTERNFKKELFYSSYMDMEDGNDIQSIDFYCLIDIITELCDRIEKLEAWKSHVQKTARKIK